MKEPSQSVDAVKVFTTAGTLVRQFGTGSHIRAPSDIEVDQSGNVYVTSFPNPAAGIQHDVITRLNPSGTVTGQWQPLPGGGVPGSSSPPKLRGIAVEPGGSMWVTTADRKDRLIHLDANGKRLKTWDPALVIPGSKPNEFRDVDHVNGRLYFGGSFSARNNGNYRNALAVVSPVGRLIDEVVGAATYVAVGASHVYLNGKVPAGSGSASTLTSDDGVTDLVEEPTVLPPQPVGAGADCSDGFVNSLPGLYAATKDLLLADGGAGCSPSYTNSGSPCPKKLVHLRETVLGGRETGRLREVDNFAPTKPLYVFEFSEQELASGSGAVLIKWDCFDPATGVRSTRWEYKGAIHLLDPSGTVLDKRTGRPVAGATVRLQVSPVAGQPFGRQVSLLTARSSTPKDRPAKDVRMGRCSGEMAPPRDRVRLSKLREQDLQGPAGGDRSQAPADPRSAHPAAADRSGWTCRRGPTPWQACEACGRSPCRSRRAPSPCDHDCVETLQNGIRDPARQHGGHLQGAYPQLLKVAKKFAKKTIRPYRVKHATFTVRRGRVVGIKLS